jgi:Type II secretion system (T2SS), protein E, N-terminal domain
MDQRIGELLSRIIPLSDHDVEEILHEQSATNQPFGDIALRLGMCKPEHILRAWLRQLEKRTDRVSIEKVGVDAQALVCLDADRARRYIALPVRALDDEMLIAVAHIPDEAALADIENYAKRRVRLVLADEEALTVAINRYYPLAKTIEAA